MKKYKPLTLKQKETRLIALIKDAEILNFNINLLEKFRAELKQIQAEIQEDKDKLKQFNHNLLRERNLKKVGDSKPLLAQENAVRMA